MASEAADNSPADKGEKASTEIALPVSTSTVPTASTESTSPTEPSAPPDDDESDWDDGM